jgi:predicted phosphodiesterase
VKFREFQESFLDLMEECPSEAMAPGSRYVVLSDLHMGDGGSRDDLAPNRALLRTALRDHYLERGYTLVLAGDVEELHKFGLGEIRRAWGPLYAVFDAFNERGALRKILGNHDLALLKEEGYPYELLHGLSLLHGPRRIFCFHGHQASRFFVKYNYLSDFIVRYLAKPLKIKNTGIAQDSRQKFKAESRIYRVSKKLGIVSVTGHTHRPLFETLSKYDSLRWTIEDLLREYPHAEGRRKAFIAEIVGIYREEFLRLKKKERKYGVTRGLYEERDFVIPSLFNSGCATARGGFTAIEIEGDATISLVHWTEAGKAKPYVEREAVEWARLEGSPYARYVLERDGLDSIFARIDLLGMPMESDIAY